MKRKAFNTELMEFDKPSGLIHSKFLVNGKPHYNLTANQIDICNFLGYTIKEQLLKTYKTTEKLIDIVVNDPDTFEKIIDTNWYSADWQDLSSFLGRYGHGEHSHLHRDMEAMKNITIRTNVLGKNKEVGVCSFSLIRKYTRFKNHFKFKLEPELMSMYLFMQPHTDETFATVYLKMQAQQLSTVAGKRLYEALKDYQGIKSKTFSYTDLLNILCLDPDVESNRKFGTLKTNHLNKALKDINEFSDINVEIEPIKDKIGSARRQVIAVKFNISKKPKEELIALGYEDEPRVESVEEKLLKQFATYKFDKLPHFRKEKIQSKDAYIAKIIETEKDELLAQIALYQFIKDTLREAEYNSDQPQTLVIFHNVSDKYFVIDNDYILIDLDTKLPISKTAIETRKQLNVWMEDEECEMQLMELGIKDEWSNSTVNS